MLDYSQNVIDTDDLIFQRFIIAEIKTRYVFKTSLEGNNGKHLITT